MINSFGFHELYCILHKRMQSNFFEFIQSICIYTRTSFHIRNFFNSNFFRTLLSTNWSRKVSDFFSKGVSANNMKIIQFRCAPLFDFSDALIHRKSGNLKLIGELELKKSPCGILFQTSFELTTTFIICPTRFPFFSNILVFIIIPFFTVKTSIKIFCFIGPRSVGFAENFYGWKKILLCRPDWSIFMKDIDYQSQIFHWISQLMIIHDTNKMRNHQWMSVTL